MKTRSSALPLALLFAGLVVYASLYPFEGWRWPGVSLFDFFSRPMTRYWNGFDVLSNLVGYMPLGFLLATGMVRSGWGGWSWWAGGLVPGALSLVMEVAQNFLPVRVPSSLDLVLNFSGAILGTGVAWAMNRLGVWRQWTQIRGEWLESGAHGGLILVAMWPFSLLYPVSIPFGLGQVWWRLEMALSGLLMDTPFHRWLPDPLVGLDAINEQVKILCAALGLAAPVLMGFADVRGASRRLAFLVLLVAVGLAVSGLSAALTYGPAHAWAWIDTPTSMGIGVATVASMLALPLPAKWCQGLLVLSLLALLVGLNQLPASAYLDQSLDVWEQGRFIRFYGLAQWLGWLWPFAALIYGVRALVGKSGGWRPGH